MSGCGRWQRHLRSQCAVPPIGEVGDALPGDDVLVGVSGLRAEWRSSPSPPRDQEMDGPVATVVLECGQQASAHTPCERQDDEWEDLRTFGGLIHDSVCAALRGQRMAGRADLYREIRRQVSFRQLVPPCLPTRVCLRVLVDHWVELGLLGTTLDVPPRDYGTPGKGMAKGVEYLWVIE